LRTVAARDLRMFFLADAIFGTKQSPKIKKLANVGSVRGRLDAWLEQHGNLGSEIAKVKAR
jgi:hypothetical protein